MTRSKAKANVRARRRGASIIELLVVMGAVSMILGLCAGLLHVLLRLDRAGRSALVEASTVGRLSRQLRQDVHAAVGARPATRDVDDEPKLELDLPDQRVVAYQAQAHALVRTQRHGGAVERREIYQLPSCRDPRFDMRAEDGRVWVVLRLPRGDEARPQGLRRDLRLVADVGRDRRRSQTEETSP